LRHARRKTDYPGAPALFASIGDRKKIVNSKLNRAVTQTVFSSFYLIDFTFAAMIEVAEK